MNLASAGSGMAVAAEGADRLIAIAMWKTAMAG
jgi:hypothetical protein